MTRPRPPVRAGKVKRPRVWDACMIVRTIDGVRDDRLYALPQDAPSAEPGCELLEVRVVERTTPAPRRGRK